MFTNYVINIYIKHTMLLYHNIYKPHIHKNTHIYGKDIISIHEMI